MEQFANYGIAGITLVILFFIVKYFVAAMTKKDETIEKQFNQVVRAGEDFSKTVSNHMVHQEKAFEALVKEIKHHK